MKPDLLSFAIRLGELIGPDTTAPASSSLAGHLNEEMFNLLAVTLFHLQFDANPAYQTLCRARGQTPANVHHWTRLPAVPAAAFKELDLTAIPAAERTTVFYSSGTTGLQASRHYHHAASLALYETSLARWFDHQLPPGNPLVFLTPDATAAPHSSLIHMFECLRRRRGLPPGAFWGRLAADGSWGLDYPLILAELHQASVAARPLNLLGTAFSLVHLLDYLVGQNFKLVLPPGSRVMETGGYKNRSRTLPKAQLHQWITDQLGVPPTHILCEYGMSELSSQAYSIGGAGAVAGQAPVAPAFQFPPWARAQVTSPETGLEVAAGQTGLLRVVDLANVFSVAALQTEDLAVRRDPGFELLGRAEKAEARGCSLMTLPTATPS